MAFPAGDDLVLSHSIVPLFGGEIYEFWKAKMRTLLLSEGLWRIVDKGFDKVKGKSQLSEADRRKYEPDLMMDARTLSKIQNGVLQANFPRIMHATTAREARGILRQQFQGYSKVMTIKHQSLKA